MSALIESARLLLRDFKDEDLSECMSTLQM
jgi:hypothetical protein